MLTSTAIEGYKKYTEKTISYAQYKLGSTWYTASVSRKERLSNGKVAVYFSIIPQSSTAVTINGVRLYDVNGDLWAEKKESIKVESVQEGVLYRFTFDLHEEEG